MTACKPIVLSTAAALTTVVMTTSSVAVSLRPNKATDDSVCDLAHDTNLFLGSKVLVPSVATKKDQVDAFFRLAAASMASIPREAMSAMRWSPRVFCPCERPSTACSASKEYVAVK